MHPSSWSPPFIGATMADIMSQWKTRVDIPEVGRKIQFVIDINTIEVDIFRGKDKILGEKYRWSQVKLWRYVDDGVQEDSNKTRSSK